MTYQSQDQFTANRLTEEAKTAAENGAANAPLIAPERSADVGPSPETGLPPVQAIDTTIKQPDQPLEQKTVHKIQAAAAEAMSSDGTPARMESLELLISV